VLRLTLLVKNSVKTKEKSNLFGTAMKELEIKISYHTSEIEKIREILAISMEEIVDKIQEIEEKCVSNLEKFFKSSNEECSRHLQEPIEIYPYIKKNTFNESKKDTNNNQKNSNNDQKKKIKNKQAKN
jgi:hypothetical protein